jgi:mannose-6-phosphate isomerase-like protein (cupin superfamily)
MSYGPTLIESLTTNNGKRTITRAVFPPGAKALLHYHTQFRETFKVHEGELTIFHGSTKQTLKTGQSSDTIKTYEVHCFKNLSHQNIVADIILEPGHLGCEMTNMILAGLEREGKLGLLSKFGGYNAEWIVLYDITNTVPVGIPRIIFSVLKFLYGNIKIEKIKQSFIEKYCR